MPDTLSLTLTGTIQEGTATQTAKRTFTATDANITQSVDDKVTIAGSVTDQLLNFDGMASVKYIILSFSGPLSVKIGSNTAPALAFPANGFLLLSGATVTAIYLTNAGTTPVTVTRLAASP